MEYWSDKCILVKHDMKITTQVHIKEYVSSGYLVLKNEPITMNP
jgi:hypothetical protein